MVKWIINIISVSILIIGINLTQTNISLAGHAEWHEGASCGQCHCEVGQECVKGSSGVCSCTMVKEIDSL